MFSLRILFCVAVLSAGGAVRLALADEMVNGGFEHNPNAASGIEGWEIYSDAKPAPTLLLSSENPHSGARCAQVENTVAGSRASLRQKYHLQQFDHYELTAWLRSDQPAMPVQVDLREAKGAQIPLAIRTFSIGTDWKQVTVRGIAPDTVDGNISISTDAVGKFFVDDVSLIKSPRETVNVPSVLTEPVDALYFGMHYHEGPIQTPYLPELSPKYLRLWDDHVAWTHLEPKKGQFDFARLDSIVAHAPPEVRIILMLGQTPAWASSRPDTKSYYGHGAAYMPRDIQDWRDYIHAVATRYKGRIKYWEVWNECNWRGFWLDSVTNMVKLTQAAHDELKAVDPTNVVLSPGFTKDLGEDFINEWFYEGAGKDVDVIAYHFYPSEASVDASFIMAQNLMELKRSYGFADLPLFNTEYGEKRHFRQAAIVGEMNLLYWFVGMQQMDYYTYDDKVFGLTLETSPGHFDTTRLNDAGIAYAQTRTWMIGATAVAWTILPNGVHYTEFKRPGGYRCFAVWKVPDSNAPHDPALPHEHLVPEQAMADPSALAPMPFKIPADWHITDVRDLTGARHAVTSGEVLLTDSPILLETSAINPD
jgi:hypothetical protein